MKILDAVILLLYVVNAQKELSEEERNASQSSDYYYEDRNQHMTADLAISGEPDDTLTNGTCSVTLNLPSQSVAWWMFTFPVDTVFITNIKINYQYNISFAGYSLYVSNSSISKTDGYLCYHHEGPGLPSAYQDVNCNYLGQHVIIYNERNKSVAYPDTWFNDFPILILCKVRIYGCYKGWWDSDCSKPCPATCVGEHCYPGRGTCVWGCDPDNCLNDKCDTATGRCTQGCKIGLRGDYCEEACNDGYFGMKCEQQCNCRYEACIKATGICPTKGCQRGWKGDTCSDECSNGDHGFDCVDRCNTCNSTLCGRLEGNCTYGCVEGFKGHQCLVSDTSQSVEQGTTDHTLNIIYAVIGTIIVITLVCVTLFLIMVKTTTAVHPTTN